MATSQILSKLRRKNALGNYETFYLGPEQRYSRPLPTSNNNNLEEQLLMGVDRIITSWYDDATNTNRQIIEFRRSSDLNNYYYLDIYKYDLSSGHSDIYVDDEGNLVFTTNMTVSGDTLEQINYDEDVYYYDDSLAILPFSTIEQDDLHYINSNNNDILVSSKIVTQSFKNNNMILEESITNYL